MFKPSSDFLLTVPGQWFFCGSVFYLCFMFIFVMLSFLFLAALWLPAEKGLTSWLSCVLYFLVLCHYLIWCSLPGMVQYLIVSIPDLCLPLYFAQGYSRVTQMNLKLGSRFYSIFMELSGSVDIQSTLVNSTMHNSILSLTSTRQPGPGILPYILLQFHNVYLDNS